MHATADYRRAAALRAEITYRRHAPYHCRSMCSWEDSLMCDDLRGCSNYDAKRQALAGPARDLHYSDTPDPLIETAEDVYDDDVPLVTGASIRAALAASTRRARLWAWLVKVYDCELWPLVLFALALFALVVAWGER